MLGDIKDACSVYVCVYVCPRMVVFICTASADRTLTYVPTSVRVIGGRSREMQGCSAGAVFRMVIYRSPASIY